MRFCDPVQTSFRQLYQEGALEDNTLRPVAHAHCWYPCTSFHHAQTSFRQLYREGALEDAKVTIEVPPGSRDGHISIGGDGAAAGPNVSPFVCCCKPLFLAAVACPPRISYGAGVETLRPVLCMR